MKKKIFSIGMIVVLVLSSMLLMATPAAAGTLSWSTQAFLGLNQVAPGTDASIVRVAPNGDIFVVDPVGLGIYKSVDGGRTYGPVPTTITGPVAYIADLQISPNYATDSTVLVLADNGGPSAQVYVSTDGGAVFGALGAPLPGGETGTCLAIAPDYVGGYGGIIAGTATGGGGGNLYQYSLAGWVTPLPAALNEDVYACAYSPNYPIDATILVVSSDMATNTWLHTKVATGAWDVNIGGAPVAIQDATPANITNPTAASIALPSDFNGSLAFNRTAYVSVISGSAVDKIYRIVAGVSSTAIDPNTFPAATDDEISSLAYSGTQTAGTLFAGDALAAQVYRSTNAYPTAPAVLISFLPANPAPTGLVLTNVALAADFASSKTVYAGTTGPESALNVSNDGGAAFYQTGLIDTTISNIQDVQAVNATEVFVVTADITGGPESIWWTEDGGLSWYRITTFGPVGGDTTADTVIIRPSPDFATDSTLYLADVTGTAMMLSNDGGNTWTPRTAPAAIADVAVKDMYTIYVASSAAGNVYSSFNGGFFFSLPMALGAQPANDIELDPGTGHILVGDIGGGVFISTGSTFTGVGAANPFVGAPAVPPATSVVTVAFDANYADNNYIYAADTNAAVTGVTGIWRHAYVPGPPAAWAVASIDGAICALPADLMVAPDGTLYATDATPAAAGPPVAGGMIRILDPAAVPAPTMVERVSSAAFDGLTAGSTLGGMTMAEGSNIIWAINNAIPNVKAYTDTLSTVTPAQVSPANGEIFSGATSATFVWDAVTGAQSYQVRYSTRTDFLAAATTILGPVNTPLTAIGTGAAALVPGMTYYWQVQVTSPIFGPWSEMWSFQTQLTPGAPNAPGILGPSAGGTNAGGYNAPLMPTFQWGTVPGATGYEFELATDAGMSDVIISETLTETAYQATMALDYSTTYYWRVRGVSATSETAWSPVIAFTTMSQPAPTTGEGGGTTVIVPTQPAPSIVIPTQPAPIITVTTGEEGGVAPGYIWAVIIIGAVLVIALIVLIVRTRRTV